MSKVSELRILSFNIHKGFNNFKIRSTLDLLKKQLDAGQFDIVCLQEVCGQHELHGNQLERLADSVWPHTAYGKNAVSTKGHYGNALMSRYPIKKWENLNISGHRVDRRGVLHVEIDCEGKTLHVLVTHLGLMQVWRKKQLESVGERIRKHVPSSDPLVLCGDFNDWNEYASVFLKEKLGLDEIFELKKGKHARTFPNWMPFLCLDRIYVRGMNVTQPHALSSKKWRSLSDHLPLTAVLDWP